MNVSNILQVSLDGPNVNIKMLKDVKIYFVEQGLDRRLIDFGSCSHIQSIMHLKVGMTEIGWDLIKL